MTTVYARRYTRRGEVIELIEESDGTVGLWNSHQHGWAARWGLGTTHAGFRNALLGWDGHILPPGQEILDELKAKL